VGAGRADVVQLRDGAGRVIRVASSDERPLPGGRDMATSPLLGCADPDAPADLLAGTSTVLDPDGLPAGTAAAGFRIDDALASGLMSAPGRGVTFVRDGAVLATTEPQQRAAGVARAADGARGGPVETDGLVISAARPLPADLLVVTSQERGSTDAALWATVLAVAGGAVALAFGIGRQLARTATRPLAELSAAAGRVTAGDLSTTLPVRSDDEVGRLATAFNTMTEELRRSVEELESSRDELRRNLSRLGEALSGTHDLGRIYEVILETAMASLRAQGGAVLLVSSGSRELLLRVGRGLDERGATPDLRVPLGRGVSGRVAVDGRPRVVHSDDPLGPPELDPAEPRARALIAVPLRSGRGVLGVLVLFDRTDPASGRAQRFDDDDLATLGTFASQASVAVDNVLLHREAQRQSITDGLTGLWNYRYLTMALARETERAKRFGHPLSVLLLDLDHFKSVNDVHGHQRGDSVLVEVAQRIKAEVREVDVVARHGGEEFVVVLPETGREGAQSTAQRLCDAVAHRPFGAPDETPLFVTVSVGVAVCPRHGESAATLLGAADKALYAVKTAGRNGWQLAVVGSD
jgi:two-component system, cell cycle response regulator